MSHRYGMAPLIRGTLVLLYLALVLPLPALAPSGLQPWLLGALPVGLLLVLAISSERVELDDTGLSLSHPAWCRWWLRRGWQLPWERITGLTPVATSQGGRVFYLRTSTGTGGAGTSLLLPQRLERFDDFLARFGRRTGLDTGSIGRISPAWTYQLLAALSALMVAAELAAGWAIATGRWVFPPGLVP
ncbi:MAG: hypothetical protein RLZZ124_447 [Cyanobacteriota bacterium]|jgi:hypothetical protein